MVGGLPNDQSAEVDAANQRRYLSVHCPSSPDVVKSFRSANRRRFWIFHEFVTNSRSSSALSSEGQARGEFCMSFREAPVARWIVLAAGLLFAAGCAASPSFRSDCV